MSVLYITVFTVFRLLTDFVCLCILQTPVQQKDDKMTNNDLRNIRQKTTDRTTRAPLEPEGEHDALIGRHFKSYP
jgi:hypothetical protein